MCCVQSGVLFTVRCIVRFTVYCVLMWLHGAHSLLRAWLGGKRSVLCPLDMEVYSVKWRCTGRCTVKCTGICALFSYMYT